MNLLTQLHQSSTRDDEAGEGEAAVLPLAVGSVFMLHVPGHCSKWVKWHHGRTCEGKRPGPVFTCLRSRKLGGETPTLAPSPGLMADALFCDWGTVVGRRAPPKN